MPHSKSGRSTSEKGQKPEVRTPTRHVCSTPDSRHRYTDRSGPFRASFGLMHCGNLTAYSITSSARTQKDSGIVRPSDFAVLRLTISSNFIGY